MFGGGGKDEDGGNFGASNFKEKQAALEQDKMNSMDMEKAAALSKELANQLKQELANTAKDLSQSLIPGFIRRYRAKKVSQLQIAESEQRSVNMAQSVKKIIKAEKSSHKEEVKVRKKLKRRNREVEILLAPNKEEKAIAEQLVKEAAILDYKERRAKQLAEVQDEIDRQVRELREKNERELLERRAFNLVHWKKQSELLHEEAVQNNEQKRGEQLNRFRKAIDRTYDEWANRDLSRAKLQVEPDHLSDPIGLPGHEQLGIFGIPMGEGAYEGMYENSGHQPGLDDNDVHVFHSEPNTDFEMATIDMYDATTEEARVERLYSALKEDSTNLNDALDRLEKMREDSERDSYQMKQELLLIEKDQKGPPKRMPLTHEIKPTHVRKERIMQLERRIEEIQQGINLASDKKRAVDAQLLGLAPKLASLREKSKESKNQLDSVNDGLGMLPMVVGRSLSLVPGMDETYKPKEMLDAITQQSKFVATRDLAKQAQKAHEERNRLDQELWVQKQSGNETKTEANFVISRLAEIQDRMKRSFLEMMKINILEALKVFLFREIPLNKVSAKITGLLPWFSHREELLSKDVIPFKSSSAMGGIVFELDPEIHEPLLEKVFASGVTLGAAYTGFCSGFIELPRLSMWSFLVTISRQGDGSEFDSGDESDFISVQFGASLGTLTKCGTYFNKVNPETGTLLFDVNYVMRGDCLAFRFDFSSSSQDPLKHLAVSVGLYEQYEMKPLEFFSDSNSGRERVLSSYVKMRRVDEKMGKFRETKLLEELIALEGSTAVWWDSDIVSHVSQRYKREYYLRILKAEILLEQKAGEAALAVALDKKLKARAHVGGSMTKKELFLDKSKTEFMMRKRGKQSNILDKGKEIVKKRIEIFDPNQGKWRHVLVMECVVRWLDNGLTAKCTHIVQEHNEGMEFIGISFEVDLAKVRWFESASQNIDEAAMEKWRRNKAYTKRLEELNTATEMKIYEMRTAYEHFRHDEENALRSETDKAIRKLDRTIDKLAEKKSHDHTSLLQIKRGIGAVLLEMKMGLIKIDLTRDPTEQAAEISRINWLQKWKEDKRRDVMHELFRKEKEVEDRINSRRLEFIEMENNVLKIANKERYLLLSQIREYKNAEKAMMMKRVKFDPAEFSKAVPKSQICEHTKTKSWGDKYGKGIRCAKCGKELSDLHKEESQTLGYGSGTTRELYDAIKAHRENEAAFRFKTTDELALVEQERSRLEKERREMEEQESYFYDFQDLRIIYEFDRRHAKFIKDSGIFRQGLQWTEEELKGFERRKIIEEKDRIKKENLVDTLILKFDPLAQIEEPPPTFRAADERRHAQNKEFMYMMGRLQTFQKKVAYLKEIRLELLSDRSMYSQMVEFLHKESYGYEQELEGIEKDLDKTGLLLATYERMQAMWKQASRIMAQANKDKRRAEMKQCGVWEDVKEIRDVAYFLHDETLSLLRVKFLFDSQLEATTSIYEAQHKLLMEKQIELEIFQRASTGLQYCRPGDPIITRLGFGTIRAYRKQDEMLFVTLEFGEPPAKMWIQAKEWIDSERARQGNETTLMEMEDEAMSKFLHAERIQTKKERFAMQNQEVGMRQYYEFLDLGLAQDEHVATAVNKAVKDNFIIMTSKNYKKMQKKKLETKMETIVKEQKKSFRDYIGPAAGRPARPTMWWVWAKRREVNEEMQKRFLKQAARSAEKKSIEEFITVRSEWIRDFTFSILVEDAMLEMVKEIAKETYTEGKVAKKTAERLSGIVFPNPKTMQFDAYKNLLEIWKRRKEDLKERIEINKGKASKSEKENTKEELSELDAALIKAKKRKERLERLRQKALNAQMEAEEAMARVFYKWELKELLRERRSMRQEDTDMKKYLKDKKRAEELAKSNAYAVSEAAKNASKSGKQDSLDRRRQDLKDIAMERRRRTEDQAYMTIEDKAGEALRDMDRKERQQKLVAASLGVSVEELIKQQGGSTTDSGDDLFCPIPDWMDQPEQWDDWTVRQQKAYVEKKSKIRERATRIQNHIALEMKLLDKMEDKSYFEWTETFSVVEQKEMETELQVMMLEEEKNQFEHDLQELNNNIQRIMVFCREKGEEELHAKSKWKKAEITARTRDKELADAIKWLELCEKRAKQRDKLKRRVTANCLWIDTDTVTGFHQRFKTELLRERLYWVYFRRILASIVTRAEIIASERRLMSIQEQLSVNKMTLLERTQQMKDRWKEIQRDEYLRMRKSLLNTKFFPGHRREVLYTRFSSWVRYYLWNRGHREAFELRYEIIKRQMDIERQFKAQLKSSKKGPEVAADKKYGHIRTQMHFHREHTVQCSVCMQFYLDSQNHSMACSYHSFTFALDCPRSCQNPGMTPMCQAHRIRRWRCCDSIKPDAVGCSRKYHIPKASDATYDKIMAKVYERDQELIETLDSKLVIARKENWGQQEMKDKRGQVQKIEDKIQAGRDKAKRYPSLFTGGAVAYREDDDDEEEEEEEE